LECISFFLVWRWLQFTVRFTQSAIYPAAILLFEVSAIKYGGYMGGYVILSGILLPAFKYWSPCGWTLDYDQISEIFWSLKIIFFVFCGILLRNRVVQGTSNNQDMINSISSSVTKQGLIFMFTLIVLSSQQMRMIHDSLPWKEPSALLSLSWSMVHNKSPASRF